MDTTQYSETSLSTTSSTTNTNTRTTTSTTTLISPTKTTTTTTSTATPSPSSVVADEIASAREDIDFVDETLTSAEENPNVTCCFPETGEARNVTYGGGLSCAGRCSAIGAELCPSGNCTSDPRDWNGRMSRGGFAVAALSTSALRKCLPRCRVKANRNCCFHPRCYKRRKTTCDWFKYTSGLFSVHQVKLVRFHPTTGTTCR